MDDWEKFNETSVLEKKKEDFYSKLNMEGITDGDVRQMKIIWKEFEMEDNGDFHDLPVQSSTCLLSDVFENLWNICNKIHKLDLACYLTTPEIGWQSEFIFKK